MHNAARPLCVTSFLVKFTVVVIVIAIIIKVCHQRLLESDVSPI